MKNFKTFGSSEEAGRKLIAELGSQKKTSNKVLFKCPTPTDREASMRRVAASVLLAGMVLLVSFSRAQNPPVHSDLAVHEWGTFTSIAGHNGQAIDWMPLSGPENLPSFVEHFRGCAKCSLRGTVRMETPVLYFHASRAMTLSVKVSFAKGVITEWYPHADRVEPNTELSNVSLYQKNMEDGNIAWDSVTVNPDFEASFPLDKAASHYYAARNTSATPLRVNTLKGNQQEKFLFYRGVSSFLPPVSIALTPDGKKLLVKSLCSEEIPNVVWFERRGKSIGYSIGRSVRSEMTLDAPELTGSLDSLKKDLEEMLVARGLYADEARAMVQTWSDSWFEEGSRLIYIVPSEFVNTILPLSIHPAPTQTVRVFVGRFELITPATEKAIQTAFESSDSVTLKKYGRFLEPILMEMMQKTSDEERKKTLSTYLSKGYALNPTEN
jgi:hypothetical protein